MAYVTAQYENLTPNIKTIHAILKVNGAQAQPGSQFQGDKFNFELNNGQTWNLYTDSNVNLIFTGQGFDFQGVYNGFLRLAITYGAEMTSVLDQSSKRVPIGGTVQAETHENSAELRFEFQTQGEGELLMFAMPHHQQILDQSLIVQAAKINTLKGDMIGVQGDVWTMTETLTSITWSAPREIQSDKIEQIRDALKADINKGVVADDTYFGGKQLAAIARLALIAHELDEESLVQTFVQNVKNSLEPWLQDNGKLVHDITWGGIVDSKGKLKIAQNEHLLLYSL